MAEDENADSCKLAWEAATEVLVEECGGPDRAMEYLGDMMGLEMDNPVSDECDAVLESGLSEDRCEDFRGIRQWVMCKTWKSMTEEDVSFRQAIKRSWDEAKAECAELGVVV